MSREEEETIFGQVGNTTNEELGGFSRLSKTDFERLKKEADMRIDDQEETLEVLRNQANRYNTIKLGVLALALIAGMSLSNGIDGATPDMSEWITSLI